jgi:hypothetical protein
VCRTVRLIAQRASDRLLSNLERTLELLIRIVNG